jgi:hypothetical protein
MTATTERLSDPMERPFEIFGSNVVLEAAVDQVIEGIRTDERKATLDRIRAAVIVRLTKADEDGEVAPLHEIVRFLDVEADR